MHDQFDGGKPSEYALAKDYDDTRDYVSEFSYSLDGVAVSFHNLSDEERAFLISAFESNRRRHRRLHQLVVRSRERRDAKIKRLHDLFTQDKTWAAVGGDIPIKTMTPNHARNSYKLITNEWERYTGGSVSFADLQTGFLDVPSTPLGKALLNRSNKRTTWRDKRNDNESRERFKDRQAKAKATADNLWETLGKW